MYVTLMMTSGTCQLKGQYARINVFKLYSKLYSKLYFKMFSNCMPVLMFSNNDICIKFGLLKNLLIIIAQLGCIISLDLRIIGCSKIQEKVHRLAMPEGSLWKLRWQNVGQDIFVAAVSKKRRESPSSYCFCSHFPRTLYAYVSLCLSCSRNLRSL